MSNLAVKTNSDYGVSEFLMNFNSENTRRAYRSDIECFFNFLRSNGRWLQSPKCLKLSDLILYRDYLLKDKTSNTVSRKLASIKSLMSWFELAGHIDTNPASSLKLPRAEVSEPTQAFTDEEVKKLLTQPDVTSFSGNMHKMVIGFLFYFGLRRSELCNIKMKNIRQEGQIFVLRVKGKGGKVRDLPFPEPAKELFKEYLDNYSRMSGIELGEDDYILQSRPESRNTAPLNSSTIYKIIKQYSDKIGINKKVSPHSCRATAITKAIEMGAVITDVADMAGHSNITTTQGYYKRRKALEDSPVYKLNY